MTYANTLAQITAAVASRARLVVIDTDMGEIKLTPEEALQGYGEIAPGESFDFVRVIQVLDVDLYENSRDGLTCKIVRDAEVIPLHCFGACCAGAPVVAWRVRYITVSPNAIQGETCYGPRHEVRERAVAEAELHG